MLEGCTKTYTVWDVAHVPDVLVNLLAVNVMQSKGVYFDGRTATLQQVTDDKLVAKCPVVDGLYRLQIVAPTALTTVTASPETSKPNPLPKTLPKAPLMEWHSRLGHISLDRIQALAKAGHITITDNTKELCASCEPAKSKQQISREPQRRATAPFERIHTDVLGPVTIPSLAGYRYALIFIDDYSRYRWIYFCLRKSEVATQFIYFWEMVSTQYSHRIGIYRLDNGQEYMNQHVETFYKEKGALLEFTAPYTPAQNGVSERTMGLVATMARSTRIAAAL